MPLLPLLLALLSGAPAADAAPPRSPVVVQCLGTSRYAADNARLEAIRAKLGPSEWRTVCRQARDANLRRLSVQQALMATGKSPVGGYQSVLSLLTAAREAKDPTVAELFRRTARDQATRLSLGSFARETYARGLSSDALALLDGLVSFDAVEVDADNRRWLKARIAERGWFTISRDGEGADRAAWLLVQHADMDREFQRSTLGLLEGLAGKGESSRSGFAYLSDRVAGGTNTPQRFGTQGACAGPGDWRPLPIADEAGVDERRSWAGIAWTMAEYRTEMNKHCS